jgi:8-oxo-dGTP pyrophosphatase MutT (NUDIX family)
MNITIYYLSKSILITKKKQNTENTDFRCLDSLKKEEIKAIFQTFIESENNLLTFESKSIEKGFDKFKKAFKLIYAAGGLIENDNNFLFIFRLNKWDLPKGKLEMGESPDEAAIRECEEECSISQLSIHNELPSTYHIYKYKGKFALKKTFWFSMTTMHQGILVPQIEEKIEKVEWLDKKQISEIVLNNTYPAILDVLNSVL